MARPNANEPTQEQWEALHAATARFKALAPWEWMHESNLFGVQDPETDLTFYCQVLGGMGEHFALSAYRDAPGLASLWQMVTRPLDAPALEPIEILGTQDCLMASFEDRAMLNKRDLDTIKSLGLKFRGRNAWPQFRSYIPYTVPWHLSAQEARQLTVCLEQAIEIAERYRQDRSLFSEIYPEGPYLVRTPLRTANGIRWEDEYREVVLPPVGGVSFSVPDDDYYEELFETAGQTDGVLELDYVVMPEGVQNGEGERPFYPFLVLTADPHSGMILGHKLVPHAEVGEAIVDSFFEAIESLKMIPQQVHAQHPLTAGILRVIAEPLEVEVREVARLRAHSEFEQEFFAFGAL